MKPNEARAFSRAHGTTIARDGGDTATDRRVAGALHLACLAVLLTVGCSLQRTGPPASNAGSAITTDRADYALELGHVGKVATIVATFRAPADTPVYIVHCNGAISWGLQKQVAGRWVDAWIVETNACLSPPIVLRGGEARTDTLTLVSRDDVPPGEGTVRHKVEPGIYRMIWYGVLTSFDAKAPPSRPLGPDLPVDARISGPIAIRDD